MLRDLNVQESMAYFNYPNWLSWRSFRSHLCTLAVSVSFNSSWRAPREGFRYGGLSFSLATTVAAMLVALPAVLLQLSVGQLSQQDAVGVWKAVPFFKGVGFLRLLISFIGSIYTVFYVGMCTTFILHTLSNNIIYCTELRITDDGSQFVRNLSTCPYLMFLTPIIDQPEYYVAMALIMIVLWIVFPFILFNPVKFMKRIFYVAGLSVCLLAIIIVFSVGTAEGISFFNQTNDWMNLIRPYIWQSALTQALLSTQTAGGYLISSGDSLYCNIDVQYSAYILVGLNIVSCWTGSLFWFAIGGNESRDTSNIAVLVQISKVTIERKLSIAWPLLVFFLLFISGIITILTFLYPLYDRFRRVSGYKWRYMSLCNSFLGAAAVMAILGIGHSPLTLLEDVVMPLMISLVTLAEISAFIFIYGWKVLVKDIEFLIGRKLQKFWVTGWYIVIGILTPITVWWIVSWFIEKPNWFEPPWEITGIVVTTGLSVALFLICAKIAIVNQVQYDFVGKLKSSFNPSRHWGPRDPISNYYWLARRGEVPEIPRFLHGRPVLGEFSQASKLATITTPKNDFLQKNKRRSNSDHGVFVNRKQRVAELYKINYGSKIRSKSLDWNFTAKMKSHTIDSERQVYPNEPIVIIKEQNHNTVSLDSLDI